MNYAIKKNSSHSFFERLCNGESKKRGRHQDHDFENEIASIKRNLMKILNSRQGHALSTPTLGLIDLNDAANTDGDFSSNLQKEIEDTIKDFEPRIVAVNATFNADPNQPSNLNISIIAEIVIQPSEKSYSGVVMNITYDNSRHYHIE